MSNQFNLDVIGEIVSKNNSAEQTIQDISNIEQATNFIKKNDSQVTLGWFNMSHALKKVRDEKLYEDKYETFEEYFKNELQYKKTMVYKFIKIATIFPLNSSNSVLNCGVTKLISLVELNEGERNELFEYNDIAKMSVSELKDKIREKKTINIENYNKTFQISQEEQNVVYTLTKDLTNFHNIIKCLSEQNTNQLSHQQIIQLNQSLDKTKKEMKKIDKMIKKYL